VNEINYQTIIDYKKIYTDKYKKYLYLYLFIIIIFVISLVMITFKLNYYTYYNGTFLLEDKKTYSIIVNYYDIEKILHNNYFIKDNKKYQYKIKEVSEVQNSSQDYFQKITITTNISKDIKIFNAKIITSKKKIFWYIVDYLKGD